MGATMTNRTAAAYKAVATKRGNGSLSGIAFRAAKTKKKQVGYLTAIANKAVETRNKPSRKAMRTERASRAAFAAWAQGRGLFHVFLDGGKPTTGIVDVLLVEVDESDRDALRIGLVQLKAGTGKLGPADRTRLIHACNKARCLPIAAFWDTDTKEVGADLISFP